MIPKIIHYVWVGNNEKNELALRCIESWRKYLPDYQIIEWGNDSLKNIDNRYVNDAFKMKKWAFVSDYLRLYALYNQGGFYFDTDLEVTANLDQFLAHSYMTGFENFNGNSTEAFPITALMAAEKNNPLIKKMLSEYDNEDFILPDGSLNTYTNTKRITKLMRQEFNLNHTLDAAETLILPNNNTVYPSYYFSTPEDGKPNFSIHHFDGSWHDNFNRNTLIKLGKFKLALFTRKDASKKFNYMHYGNESVLYDFSLSKNSRICLLRSK